MVRISGINIPDKKRIEFALPYLYGIGRSSAKKILAEAKIDAAKLSDSLSADELNRIRTVIESRYMVEGELRRQIASNIRRLKDVRAYRGIRHIKGLPTRGQRTRTNSRTRRGNIRKTAVSGKRKVEKK
jgi:small subunit ribosomal protein S13